MPLFIIPRLSPWWISAVILGWDPRRLFRFLKMIRGKKICLLGERRVGKTVLANFIATGKLPRDSEYAQGVEEIVMKDGWTIDFTGKGEVCIRQIRDLPGPKDFRKAWKDAVGDSDYVVYLFRADQLSLKNIDNKRLISDVRHVRDWLESRPGKKRVCLVGTHCDLIEGYENITKGSRGDFEDTLLGMAPLKEMTRILGIERAVFGSLKTKSAAKAVVAGIFRTISER